MVSDENLRSDAGRGGAASATDAGRGHSDLAATEPRDWPPLTDPALSPRHSVLILAGGFGSGKTEIALNLCLGLKRTGVRVRLADLDIVKPFFRCREARELLEAAGVELIAPPGEQFYSDLPVILPQIRGMIRNPGNPGDLVVLDVGGDPTGARVLASLADAFRPDEYDFLLVLNTSRPFQTDLAGLARMCDEVKTAAGLAPTGLIANTHLLDETDPELVWEGYQAVREMSVTSGIPIRMVACVEELAAQLAPDRFECPVLPLRRVLGLPETRGVRKSPLYYV